MLRDGLWEVHIGIRESGDVPTSFDDGMIQVGHGGAAANAFQPSNSKVLQISSDGFFMFL